jgi:antitoxin component YwqK of YwqJK toxin-antitoxin module
MRYLFLGLLFLSTTLFAQRDSLINGIKCHLVSENKDTGTAWIQQKLVKKGVTKFRGTYYEFYPGGKLKAKGYYKNGKRTEKWIRYYSSGKKAEEGYFDAGYKSDLWMTYYESGQLSWKGNFFKNIRSGYWRYYYEDGKLKAMTRYRIKTDKVIKKAKKKSKGVSFKVNKEFQYRVSPADSLVEYYPDGKLRTRIIYGKEGGLNGDADFYYENGKLNKHGKYIDGKLSGDWVRYCTSGAVFIPNTNTNPDVICFYEELNPWLKWEVEVIIP